MHRPSSWLAVTLTLLSAPAWAPAWAAAQDATAPADRIAEARTRLDEMDFEQMDRLLDEIASGPLDSAQLLGYLELRVLAAFSADHYGAMEEALAGLATLLPADASAPSSFPSSVGRRLDELRASGAHIDVAGVVTSTPVADGRDVGVVGEVRADPGHLVRRVVVHAVVDDAASIVGEGGVTSSVRGSTSRAVSVRYWLEAFGPGDALVATSGSAEAPIDAVVDGTPPDDTGLHVGIVITVVTLVGAGIGVAIAAVATDGFRLGGGTMITGPRLVEPAPIAAELVRF